MVKGTLISLAALLVLGGAALAAERSGLIESGNSSGLVAAEVRLAPAGAVSAQEAPPVEVLGAAVDCPPTGAGPEDTQLRYEEQGGAFRVIGTLSSFDAITAVVAGPTGNISATLAQQFDLRGDLTGGSTVDLRGTIADGGARTAHQVHSACASAGVIDCAAESDPQFQLHVAGDSFQVTGRLESLTADQIRVMGPGLIVEIRRDAGTQVEGTLNPGDPVRVEGKVLSDRQLQALTVALRCEQAVAQTATPAVSPSPQASLAVQEAECGRGNGRSALRLEVDDGEVRIKRGEVVSANAGSVTVDTPRGPIAVRIDEDTEVSGDLAAAVQVQVEGELDDEGAVQAAQVDVLCATADEGDERDEDGEGNEDGKRRKNNDRGGGGEGEQGKDDEGGGDDEGGEED
jgi:Domain of unknown function (DUF5666)